MRSFFCVCFFFLLNACFATERLCSCYGYPNDLEISSRINKFVDKADYYYLWTTPPYRERWESPYHKDFKYHLSQYPDCMSMRYPDVYQKILLFEERIDLLGNFWIAKGYEDYLSENMIFWGHTKAEREVMFTERKERALKSMSICKEFLHETSFEITKAYINIFEGCLAKNHQCLATLHDYGLFAYLNNNLDKSLELLSELIDQAEASGELDKLDDKVYHNLGSVCSEALAYDKAIEYLTESIQKNPENKKVYFDRALAYFETGAFDLALNDYKIADKGPNTLETLPAASSEFTTALLSSLAKGAKDGAIEFGPSLCNSVHGLGQCLWASTQALCKTVQHPVDSTKNFANACYKMGECAAEYWQKLDSNTVKGYVRQLKILCKNYDQLSPTEKGELIGYAIGRYGIDIFAGGASMKAVSAFRNLKKANGICNLEEMLISKTTKKELSKLAVLHASERETFLKSVKIHWDKQNKHIPGKHNFMQGKGKIHLEASELELLVKERVGTGQRVLGEFGEAGFKERVDFGKIIGDYALVAEGQPTQYLPTSKGMIIYAKNGLVHVVPSDPGAIIL